MVVVPVDNIILHPTLHCKVVVVAAVVVELVVLVLDLLVLLVMVILVMHYLMEDLEFLDQD